MNRTFTAYIERDIESGMYIGSVPIIPGAHTQAETIEELRENLKDVIALCLEDTEGDEKAILSTYEGVLQVEVPA